MSLSQYGLGYDAHAVYKKYCLVPKIENTTKQCHRCLAEQETILSNGWVATREENAIGKC